MICFIFHTLRLVHVDIHVILIHEHVVHVKYTIITGLAIAAAVENLSVLVLPER